jgi:hypothetical protein
VYKLFVFQGCGLFCIGVVTLAGLSQLLSRSQWAMTSVLPNWNATRQK